MIQKYIIISVKTVVLRKVFVLQLARFLVSIIERQERSKNCKFSKGKKMQQISSQVEEYSTAFLMLQKCKFSHEI